jgi:hypothetical protein
MGVMAQADAQTSWIMGRDRGHVFGSFVRGQRDDYIDLPTPIQTAQAGDAVKSVENRADAL